MPSFNRRVDDFQPSFLVTQNAENQKFKETTHIYNCIKMIRARKFNKDTQKWHTLGARNPFCKSFFWYPGIRLKFARSARFPCVVLFSQAIDSSPGSTVCVCLHPSATTWIERPIARPRWRYAGSWRQQWLWKKGYTLEKSKHPTFEDIYFLLKIRGLSNVMFVFLGCFHAVHFQGCFTSRVVECSNTPTSEFPRPHGQLSKNPDPLSRIGLRHPCDTVDGWNPAPVGIYKTL